MNMDNDFDSAQLTGLSYFITYFHKISTFYGKTVRRDICIL